MGLRARHAGLLRRLPSASRNTRSTCGGHTHRGKRHTALQDMMMRRVAPPVANKHCKEVLC